MTTTALILSIAIAAFGSLLLIVVGAGQQHRKDVERKENEKAEYMYKELCISPLIYPVCSECKIKENCEIKKKINI